MSKASQEFVNQLHGLLADAFRDELTKYQQGVYLDKEGNPLPVPAALMAQIAKFLKDNGTDAPAIKGNKVDKLADMLPTFDAESEMEHYH